jgi:hypothetical protein
MHWSHQVFMEGLEPKKKGKKVPESCIQSAEFIIQTTRPENQSQVWVSGMDLKPAVWMHFENGSYDITNVDLLPEEKGKVSPVLTNSRDFNVRNRPPGPGEGVAFWNVGSHAREHGYNMHFMAVLAISETDKGEPVFVVSDVSAVDGEEDNPRLVSLEKDNIRTLIGSDCWHKERDEYQKDNGGDFRIAILSMSKRRPLPWHVVASA